MVRILDLLRALKIKKRVNVEYCALAGAGSFILECVSNDLKRIQSTLNVVGVQYRQNLSYHITNVKWLQF